MARGESGRIVLEIDPSEKDELYTALKKDGLTLKDWFLKKAAQYVSERNQGMLFAEEPVTYKIRASAETKKKISKGKSKA
jgi:hypothetical protein